MKEHNYTFLQKYIKQESGIVLQTDKMYLVNSRFSKILTKYDLESNDQIAERIRFEPRGELAKDVVDVLTTNETSFYRDASYFNELKNSILPQFIEKRKRLKSLRIWSAAASSGQEAYSIAMLLKSFEYTILKGWKISIIGTDLSRAMIEKAKNGVYSQFEVQRGLPIDMLLKHFEQEGSEWRIKEHIRNMVEFYPMNLMDASYSVGMCDIIICKNVLIYFNEELKINTIHKLKKKLSSDGYLILGSTDMVANKVTGLQQVEGNMNVYRICDDVLNTDQNFYSKNSKVQISSH